MAARARRMHDRASRNSRFAPRNHGCACFATPPAREPSAVRPSCSCSHRRRQRRSPHTAPRGASPPRRPFASGTPMHSMPCFRRRPARRAFPAGTLLSAIRATLRCANSHLLGDWSRSTDERGRDRGRSRTSSRCFAAAIRWSPMTSPDQPTCLQWTAPSCGHFDFAQRRTA